jgi:hypothetical protein
MGGMRHNPLGRPLGSASAPDRLPRFGKRCAQCQTWKPYEAFTRNPRMRDGFDSWCRACHGGAARSWYERNADAVLARRKRKPPTEHTCSECGTVFFGRANRIVCSNTCRERRRRRLNPEAERERQRAKYQRRKERASIP